MIIFLFCYRDLMKLCFYLSMAPRKDHAKSRKSDLPYVTNSLNILLYDVFSVKINVYSKTSV